VTSPDRYIHRPTACITCPAGGGRSQRLAEGIPNPKRCSSSDERTSTRTRKDGEYLLAFDVKAGGRSPIAALAKYKSVTQRTARTLGWPKDNGAAALPSTTTTRVCRDHFGVEVFQFEGHILGVIPAVWGGDAFMLKKPQNSRSRVKGKRRCTWWARAPFSRSRR